MINKIKDVSGKLVHSIPGPWKQPAVLLLITPILTELLTNNIPASHFFEPGLFITLVFIVYGPVLLLREIAVRWNLKVAGYILLGLAYGIYNEGLLGKTIFQSQIVNTVFNNYGVIGGINLPWTAVIIVFHAFFAFLFPVIIVYNIFPKDALKPWIQKKWLGILILACFSYITYTFLKNTYPAEPVHYVVLIILMSIFICLSKIFTGGFIMNDKKSPGWIIAFYGVIFVATTFTLSHIIANSKINYIFFIAYSIVNLLIAIIILNNNHCIFSLLNFVLAAQFGFAVSTIIVAKSINSGTGVLTGSIFALIFASFLLISYKRKKTLTF